MSERGGPFLGLPLLLALSPPDFAPPSACQYAAGRAPIGKPLRGGLDDPSTSRSAILTPLPTALHATGETANARSTRPCRARRE